MNINKTYGKRALSVSLLLGLGLLAAGLAAVCIGPVRISPPEIAYVLTRALLGTMDHGQGALQGSMEVIVLQIRMPRIILAALVGFSLSTSGVVLQAILKNPLAEPYLLGISSGAAFGATLAMLFGLGAAAGFNAVPLMAFFFGLGTTFLVYNLSRTGGPPTSTTLLLAGIATGSFLFALTQMTMVLSGEDLHRVIFWLMGGLDGTTWSDIATTAPLMAVAVIPVYLLARDLNLLLLGDDPARSLGVNVEKLKIILLAAVSLATTAAVSVSGIIGFVGLIIPHTVRILTGPDHRILLPASGMAGAIFLVAADTVARTAGGSMEIPVGVITALCGAPFFLYLLRKEKKFHS